jgi:hypothetical protein
LANWNPSLSQSTRTTLILKAEDESQFQRSVLMETLGVADIERKIL